MILTAMHVENYAQICLYLIQSNLMKQYKSLVVKPTSGAHRIPLTRFFCFYHATYVFLGNISF